MMAKAINIGNSKEAFGKVYVEARTLKTCLR
jgi:hypothetical protein